MVSTPVYNRVTAEMAPFIQTCHNCKHVEEYLVLKHGCPSRLHCMTVLHSQRVMHDGSGTQVSVKKEDCSARYY